ncbi:MAG: hypothetical protein PVJ43_05050 [Gemmatimonadales bacterium]
MRQRLDELPVAMDQAGMRVLTPGNWGGMVVELVASTQRVDFSPMFKGLPDDVCPCPHWGYMVRGACTMQYADGSEEKISEGEVYYMPAAHTGWMEPDSAMLVFSPEKEAKILQEHFAKLMGG